MAMESLNRDWLRKLGSGEPIKAICRAVGISRAQFVEQWKQTAADRVPPMSGSLPASVARTVEIERDNRGIPHIYAENDADLFFGFGYAMAQDRLFQLDWLRRKGAGRLAEILGRDGLEHDLIARTVGLNRIAEAEWERLPDETKDVLTWFSAGVNALIENIRGKLPIEFDLLDYEPKPWR